MDFQRIHHTVDVARIFSYFLHEQDNVALGGEIIRRTYKRGECTHVATHEDSPCRTAAVGMFNGLPLISGQVATEHITEHDVILSLSLCVFQGAEHGAMNGHYVGSGYR